ncbi:MAG: DNA mismatch repair protein MutS [Flavobacteriales bacterium]|nr:MAG: DNA mismatch repair protein MutS [Flavobacteriales bacterium]
MSSKITLKTLNDLEFNTVLNRISEFTKSVSGRAKVMEIKPITAKIKLIDSLKATQEYLSSFESENKIPRTEFSPIDKELHLLGIENSIIEPEGWQKIVNLATTTQELLLFFKQFKGHFPTLFNRSDEIQYHKEIAQAINKIITRFGEISNNASANLKNLRREIKKLQYEIGVNFDKVLKHYAAHGFLDDIRETIIDNQRVLAVQAMYRKKVKGAVLGTSKTGSITYISPEATAKLNKQLVHLLADEQEEIIRILKTLADKIRPYKIDLSEYQNYLTELDVISAKANYALSINACLPILSRTKKVYMRDAFHPILLENNRKKNITTVPQTLSLNNQQQIIVISGPNAGGKSITLKTAGLLQVMIQSGILIPVHEKSEVYFFDTILTDIGDNQSIEYQLSTYSYRLKNMRAFLHKCNANTLFLIDEFGTGSDPELGGALAEVFLEEFYQKNAYGLITTHYANLKVLANEMENVANANMQFNEKTLEPLFKLDIGQAGSSFTFEVAQKNGIPFRLINRAKKKVERQKLRLDRTISKLQKERHKLQKTTEHLSLEKNKAVEKSALLSEQEQQIQEKLNSFQELYSNDQKMLQIGRKINEISNKFFQTNNQKQLLAEFKKWALMEKSKHDLARKKKENKTNKIGKKSKKQHKKIEKEKAVKLARIKKEVLAEVNTIKAAKQKAIADNKKMRAAYTYKIKDRVRLIDGTAVGTIEKIEKNTVFLNYGTFTTQAKLNQLELVESHKK